MDLLLSIIGALILYTLFRIKKGYFSFYQLSTGFPESVGFWSISLRLSLLFFVPFIMAILLNLFEVNYGNYLKFGVGTIFALFILVPPIFNKELLPEEVIKNNREKEVYLIYFILLLTSIFLSFLGFSVGETTITYFGLIAPSRQGLLDGLWVALIWFISSKLISCLHKKIQ